HKYANGTPRIINNLCDLALVYGFAEQKPRIGTKIVEEVVRDKAKGGLFAVDEPEDTAVDNSVA
ncbi:MAG: general secretion pathway protein, partial [Gammaproteobacteria bacterium]|nr:general secretion pathway protein [Gammaproteobacteria bacterium]